MKNTTLFLFLLFQIISCAQPIENKKIKISGKTQGTYYHVTYISPEITVNKQQIDSVLHRFDLSLNSYIPNSIISKVNRNESMLVDSMFIHCIKESKKIAEMTDGNFDITIAPIVDAWGFGSGKKQEVDSSVIDSLLQFVGYEKIKIKGNRLIKTDPRVQINVNAVAQGYSVDVVCDFLEKKGIQDYLVEIGGELKANGQKPFDKPWLVGVDKPEANNFMGEKIFQIIKLNNKALATSGNYRSFYEKNGQKYTHTIDPKTGYTVKRNLLSATILTDQCLVADAMATACMVVGLEKSIELIKKYPYLDAYFIYSDEKGAFKIYFSEGFKDILVNHKK